MLDIAFMDYRLENNLEDPCLTTLYLSRFPESCFVLIMYCTYSLSYAWSRDLICKWAAVHNQNKQRFLNETFKTR